MTYLKTKYRAVWSCAKYFILSGTYNQTLKIFVHHNVGKNLLSAKCKFSQANQPKASLAVALEYFMWRIDIETL